MTDPTDHDSDSLPPAVQAGLRQLRHVPLPVSDGLEGRLLAAMPLRPRRPVAGWLLRLAGAAAACVLVGVLAWQAGRDGRTVVREVVREVVPADRPAGAATPQPPPSPQRQQDAQDVVVSGPQINPWAASPRDIRRQLEVAGAGVSTASLPAPPPVTTQPAPPAATQPAPGTKVWTSPVGWTVREGLVALWSGEGDARDGAGRNHGTISGAVTFAAGKVGQAFRFDGQTGSIDAGIAEPLRITGNLTIALWIYPERLGQRQNVIHKAWGGEGIIVLEPGGAMDYAFGTGGADGGDYMAFHSDGTVSPGRPETFQGRREVLKPNRWTHVALVRDLSARKLTWYFDGEKVCECDAMYPQAAASNLPLRIGKGHEGHFAGLLDEIGIWNRALTADQVRQLFQTPVSAEAFFTGCAPALIRAAGADRLVLKDGGVLMGALANPSVALKTARGTLTVPADRLAGIAPAPGGRAWVLLEDSQALLGDWDAGPLRLDLPAGGSLEVPLDRLGQLGRQLKADAPEGPPPGPAIVCLRNGERLAWTKLRSKLTLRTPCGDVPLAPEFLWALEPAPDRPGRHRARFLNGSTLPGELADEKLTLLLQLGPEAAVERGQLVAMTFPTLPVAPHPETACLTLRSGERLFGNVEDKALTVGLAVGPVTFPPAVARSLAFADGRVAVCLWDESAFSGSLAAPAVAFTVSDGGPALKVPAGQILSITRAIVLPPPAVVDKVEALVKRLGVPLAADREAATKALIAMGRGVAPVLRRHEDSPDAEVAQRIRLILTELRANPPADPPPPPVRPPRARVLMERH